MKYRPAVFADKVFKIHFNGSSARMTCPVPSVVDIVCLKSRLTVCNKKRSVTLVKPKDILPERCLKVPNIFVESFDTDCPVIASMDDKCSVIQRPESRWRSFCGDIHCGRLAVNFLHYVDGADRI